MGFLDIARQFGAALNRSRYYEAIHAAKVAWQAGSTD
jgi:hypothetical protein